MNKRFVFFMAIILCQLIMCNVVFADMLNTKYGLEQLGANKSVEQPIEFSDDSVSMDIKLKEVLAALDEKTPNAAKIKKLLQEIKNLDKKNLEEFAKTEAFMKENNVSEDLLKRHYDYVDAYKSNMKKLQKALKTFDESELMRFIFKKNRQANVEKINNIKNDIQESWLPK